MDGFPKENWKRQSLLRDVLVVTISETLARIFFILSRNYQYHHPNVLSKSSFERSTLLTLSKLIYTYLHGNFFLRSVTLILPLYLGVTYRVKITFLHFHKFTRFIVRFNCYDTCFKKETETRRVPSSKIIFSRPLRHSPARFPFF